MLWPSCKVNYYETNGTRESSCTKRQIVSNRAGRVYVVVPECTVTVITLSLLQTPPTARHKEHDKNFYLLQTRGPYDSKQRQERINTSLTSLISDMNGGVAPRASFEEDRPQQRPNTFRTTSSSMGAGSRNNGNGRVPINGGLSSLPPTKYRRCTGSGNPEERHDGGGNGNGCGGVTVASKSSSSSSCGTTRVPNPHRKILGDKSSTCNSAASNGGATTAGSSGSGSATKGSCCSHPFSSNATVTSNSSSTSTSDQQSQNFFTSMLGFSPNEFLPLQDTIRRYHQESSASTSGQATPEGGVSCVVPASVGSILDINKLSDDALGTCLFSGFLDTFETARLTLVCQRIRQLAHEKVQKLDLRRCTNLTPQHLETIVSCYYNLTVRS